LAGSGPQVEFSGSGWLGPIELDSGGAQLDSKSHTVLAGPITGFGRIRLVGDTFELSGSADNTFNGHVEVHNRLLLLNKTGGARVLGNVTVGGARYPQTNELQWLNHSQLSDASFVYVETNGLVDLNGFSEAVEALYMRGGRVETGAGTLSLFGPVSAYSNNTPAVINGRLFFSGQSGFPDTHTF
jgi:hypothetical protein